MESPLHRFSQEVETYYRVVNWLRYIFLITAMASNLLVCFVMMKTKGHRKTLSKFFIFNLAITDILFKILEIYELITERVTDGLPFFHCKITVFCQYICAAVLFNLLAGIAVDRSKHIIYPLQSFKHRRNYHGKRIVALIWLYALIISAAFLYSATSIKLTRHFHATGEDISQGSANNTNVSTEALTFTSPKTHCVAGPRVSDGSQIAFTIYFVLGFLVPLCTMAICYTRVFYFLSNRAKNTMLNKSVVKSKLKTVFTLLLLVLSFLVSWGPILMLDLLESFVVLDRDAELWLRPLVEVLCLSNSVLNPFIYAFGNASFRTQVIALLTCDRKFTCFSQ